MAQPSGGNVPQYLIIDQQNRARAYNTTLAEIAAGTRGANTVDASFFREAAGIGGGVNTDLFNKAQAVNTEIARSCVGGTCNREQAISSFNTLFPTSTKYVTPPAVVTPATSVTTPEIVNRTTPLPVTTPDITITPSVNTTPTTITPSITPSVIPTTTTSKFKQYLPFVVGGAALLILIAGIGQKKKR